MYEEDKNAEISKRKAVTTAFNALQQLFWPYLYGEDPCSLNHYSSQRAREDAWWDMYSSEDLNDWQVWDQDGLKENYIR